MKKHLALVLALVMVLGSFSFVSAAPEFSDVKGTPAEEAVMSLELLNVLKGYPDGTFKPANTISRAEFAAVAVRVSGLEQAAMSAKGLPTGFNDVPAWHWASGYVGTAAKLGIVNGVGNGMFAPEAPVKYEEAITMIVRALGYEPAAAAKGGYPFGYLIVANEIDLLEDALGTQGTFATRGFVAQITFNALEIPMMIQNGYGTETRFVVSGTDGTDEEYLIDQMGFTSVEGRVTDYDNDDMEIEMDVVEENGVDLLGDGDEYTETYDVMEGFDFYKVHGLTVKAWLDGDKVVLTKLVDNVMFDAVEFTEDGSELTLVMADKDYDLVEDQDNDVADDYLTQFIIADGNVFYSEDDDFNVDYAKVVLDGGDVIWAEGFVFDEFMFVEEVDDMVLVDMDDEETDVEDYLIVKDGKTIEASDVEKGDLVLLFNDDYRNYDGFAVVANMMEEGVVTKAYDIGNDNTATDAFKLDGTTYDLSQLGAMYVDDSSLKAVDTDALEGYVDAEETITVYTDFYGEVVIMMGEMANVTSTYGAMLTEDANVYSGRSGETIAWDMVNELGEEVSFNEVNADRDDVLVKDNLDNVANEHDVVEYVLDEDGDLDEDVVVLTAAVLASTTNSAVEIDDRYAEGFRLQADSVVFLLDSDGDIDEVFLWEDAEDFFGEMTKYDVYAEEGEVTYLVVFDSDAGGDFNAEAGVVVNRRNLSGGDAEFTINIEGIEYSIDVDSDEFDAGIVVGNIVEFDINDDMDAIENLVLATTPELVTGTASAIQVRAETLVINSTEYELTNNAVIYDVGEDDILVLRDLYDMQPVSVKVYKDNNSIRFISYIVVNY